MHETSVQSVEDMSALGDLHEAAILYNIHQRYRANRIYVSVVVVRWVGCEVWSGGVGCGGGGVRWGQGDMSPNVVVVTVGPVAAWGVTSCAVAHVWSALPICNQLRPLGGLPPPPADLHWLHPVVSEPVQVH